MGLRSRFERAIGLGPSDEPRAVRVDARRAANVRPVVSTPGARVRIASDGWDRHIGDVSLMCHRRGVPVERISGTNGIWLDGEPITAEELRKRIGELA